MCPQQCCHGTDERTEKGQLTELISGLGVQDLAPMSVSLSHSLSRYKLKFSPDKESLSGRKYLLVLDNIQIEDEAEWSKLREPLSGGVRGSKVLVTTRSQSVARLMGTSLDCYALQALPTDACWALFQEFAFPEGGGEAYPILNEIGLDIVRKSEGIPLAAKVFGSLLRSDRDEMEWRIVSDGLSHSGPEGWASWMEKLVHQWIAEGLIPSPGDGTYRKMEDIGNEYFNDFLRMSLFEGVSNCEDGRIEDFRMKYLIRNPVPQKMYYGEVELFCEMGWRATIVCNDLSSAAFNDFLIKKSCSLHLISRGNDLTKMIQSLFKSLGHVRVLNLSNCGITTLHKSVGDLIYLRYLDLSNNLMSRLPETICDLLNLQSLDLSSFHALEALRSLNIVKCIGLESLPSGLALVSSLHNLAIRGCPKIKELPDWIGNLVSLRSLAISECENIKLLPDGKQRLRELQHLSIRGCPDLEARCQKDTGEDWHKISHIPSMCMGSSNTAASSSSS
ncbi:hypothetical protein BUALT_Bualt03G0202700 [Buddleja alternifolia]|uniref:NB-ARC domain-containing protein n=1 Tax=Buddleja alternifolia TaxID=168488 RepID=A0AAV6Y3W8_9LAMI|nr:hypothetical protein BUALT_Bualt03G0202700 [Buddleja alternifolia]